MLEDRFRIDELELLELMELRRHQSPGNDVGGCWLLLVVGCVPKFAGIVKPMLKVAANAGKNVFCVKIHHFRRCLFAFNQVQPRGVFRSRCKRDAE